MAVLNPVTLGLLLTATILNGILAGGSVEKALVELPARRRMDLLSFVQFSRAADLGRGLIFYPVLGVGAPLVTFAAVAKIAVDGGLSSLAGWGSILAAVFSIGHLVTTSRAAPRMLSLRKEPIRREEAEATYRIFEHWHAARAVLQVAAFLATLALLVLSAA